MKALILRFWPILLILLLAVVLRLPLLSGSLWLDEAAQALESSRPWAEQLQIVPDFQPPQIHLLVHLLLRVSRSEAWLRTGAALIPALISIAVTYYIASWKISRKAGLLTGLFLATSSFHIFYSQELRPYALPLMWATLSWFNLVYLERLSSKSRGNSIFSRPQFWWLVFIFDTTMGLYSSYLYPFVLAGQLVYAVAFRQQFRRPILLSSLASCIFFLPWIPLFLAQLRAGQLLRVQLSGWENVVSFSQLRSLPLTAGKFIFGVLDLEPSVGYFLLSGLFIALLGTLIYFSVKKTRSSELWSQYGMGFCWLVVPILTAWLASFFVPVLQPKRVLFSLPAFYLILSALILSGFELGKKHQLSRYIAGSFVVLILFINIFSTFSYYIQPKYHREDWRSLHAEITQQYNAEESVAVFAFTAPFASWVWYNTDNFPSLASGVISINSAEQLTNLKEISNYQYVLAFEYLRDLTDSQNLLLSEIERYGYREVDRITPSTPIGVVRVYARPDIYATRN